jgi:sugar O-acyltransferase (sialic acid O-acetyltransferase NeuD family)
MPGNGRPNSGVARPLLIFPYNGNGIEAVDCLDRTYRLVDFVDDTPEKQGTGVGGHYPVLSMAAFVEFPDSVVLAVPGSPATYRSHRAIIESLEVSEDRFACVIHPAARVSPMSVLGWNIILMAGVVVTSDAIIGRYICVLPNTVIHHDSVIGEWSLVGSNVTIAGDVRVGKNCYIGSGCSIMNGVRVGDGAFLGLGSTIIRDVPAGGKIVGNPGRQIA